MRTRITFAILTALALTACGGSSGGDADDTNDEAGNETDADSSETDAADDTGSADGESNDAEGDDGEGGDAESDTAIADDVPVFLSDLDRVCSTETGFGGLTPYSEGPGPHPFVLMQESDSGFIFERNLTNAPAGWNVQTDADFEDNSEIVPTELVACAIRSATAPTGIMCDLEGDDGTVTTLEIVDVTYEVTIHEATTGAPLGSETVEAVDADCPTFVFVDDGETQYFNAPTEDQYINAVKAFVTPGA